MTPYTARLEEFIRRTALRHGYDDDDVDFLIGNLRRSKAWREPPADVEVTDQMILAGDEAFRSSQPSHAERLTAIYRAMTQANFADGHPEQA